MADSVKIVMDQIDEETGKLISHVMCGWYGMDRNEANALSMFLAQGVVSEVVEMSVSKAEMQGNGPAAEELKKLRRK